jgi:hypothetical protein
MVLESNGYGVTVVLPVLRTRHLPERRAEYHSHNGVTMVLKQYYNSVILV